MANIVKYNPAIVRRVDQALDLVRRREEPPGRIDTSVVSRVTLIALPRICVIFNKPYLAYYRVGAGTCQHTQCGQVTRAAYTQTFNERKKGVYAEQIGDETCCWCGVSGRGALYCLQCHQYICWGTSVNGRTALCVCGNDAAIGGKQPAQVGLVVA
jgi:hypothetical protein